MMLGKLVNKFKKQSINDQGLSPPKTVSSAPALLDSGERQVRKSARLNPGLFPNPKKFPSSYESDNDDELEQLEKMSNTSLGIGSVCSENICGQSPPVLTSSPPLISEIDTNSWDSAGCESGIVLRESAERDDSSRNIELLDEESNEGDASTPVESALHAELAKKPERGAFQPVYSHSTCSPTPIGEKRRWGSSGLSIDTGSNSVSPVPPSPVASRTRSALAHQTGEDEVPRAVLTAKRSRVKVIYHDPTPRRSSVIAIPHQPVTFVTGVLSESPPNNPSLKRGRHSKGGSERPCLDFDKMREQMMKTFDAENVPFCREGGTPFRREGSTPDFGGKFPYLILMSKYNTLPPGPTLKRGHFEFLVAFPDILLPVYCSRSEFREADAGDREDGLLNVDSTISTLFFARHDLRKLLEKNRHRSIL
ncbi:hypothetical protein FO519_006100 [Halicephalobus sp. NKZ332]|nr:hypothetical protein FO519_006100 [Halicephalobus sp. NKZ332]